MQLTGPCPAALLEADAPQEVAGAPLRQPAGRPVWTRAGGEGALLSSSQKHQGSGGRANRACDGTLWGLHGEREDTGPRSRWVGNACSAHLSHLLGPDGHSSSSHLSVRWPLLCRRMPTSFPADRRLQRELFPELARLLYLLQPLLSDSRPG